MKVWERSWNVRPNWAVLIASCKAISFSPYCTTGLFSIGDCLTSVLWLKINAKDK